MSGKWDRNEHEGCGVDSERAFKRWQLTRDGDMSLDDYQIDALKDERDSGLTRVVQLLKGRRDPNEVAWWLCANHAKFIIDHPNLTSEAEMIRMAEQAGDPPKGDSWVAWFDRVRNLRPIDVLKRS